MGFHGGIPGFLDNPGVTLDAHHLSRGHQRAAHQLMAAGGLAVRARGGAGQNGFVAQHFGYTGSGILSRRRYKRVEQNLAVVFDDLGDVFIVFEQKLAVALHRDQDAPASAADSREQAGDTGNCREVAELIQKIVEGTRAMPALALGQSNQIVGQETDEQRCQEVPGFVFIGRNQEDCCGPFDELFGIQIVVVCAD